MPSEISHSKPSVAFLDVPQRCSRYLHQPSDVTAFVINNFLDAKECKELTSLACDPSISTGLHYVTEAAHTDNDGVTHTVKLQEANQHKLSVFEHPPTLDRLWKKIRPIIVPHIKSFIEITRSGPPVGLNPRLRVLRYDAADNDVFKPHFDATTKVNNLSSLLTVLIYLNDGNGIDFDGGETCYLDHTNARNMDIATKITPSTGSAVIFEHNLFHSSAPLKFGFKNVLRTDVLFEYGGEMDKPRGRRNNKNKTEKLNRTLLEVCQELFLPEEEKAALDDIGLLDLTLDSLFAPGESAVWDMFHDVMDKEYAGLLMEAVLKYR